MIRIDEDLIARYLELSAKVLRSGFLSEGEMTKSFERGWENYTGLPSVAVSSGGFALWALCESAQVRGFDVVVPTNTFMATPLSVEKAGGRVVFADCSRQDLCLTVDSIQGAITKNTKAVILVHIGGHLAFETQKIAEYCKSKGLTLIEDCAHAHGATFRGKHAGEFGFGGAYSFYATKTLPIGEGGMVVSHESRVIDFVRTFRNYGKFDYKIAGFHGRMTELTAALGVAQLERLPDILRFKRELAQKYDTIFPNHLQMPEEFESGYYKYILFDTATKEETGKVYADLCHELRGGEQDFPNSKWITRHHSCPPIWYGYDGASLSAEELRKRLSA